MVETVSFIAVTSDGKDHLAVLLESIARLDYPSELVEVLVVDNASADGTVEWLKRAWPRVRILSNDCNEGFARPNNVAAHQATGKWLALVNNDMKLDEAWLREMLGALEGETQVCAASRILDWEGKKLDFDGSAIAFTGHGLQPAHGMKIPPAAEKEPIPFACGGAMLIRRDVFLEVGGFDEDYFAYYEDVDLGWRLWLCGYEVVKVPRAVAYHRHNATSRKAPSFQKTVLMERNALYTIIKNLEAESLCRVLPAALLLAEKRFGLASGVDRQEFRFHLPGKVTPTGVRPPEPGIPWQKAFRSLCRKGIGHAARKVALAFAEAILRRWGRMPFEEGGVMVDRSAYAIAVAMEDVADHLDSLWKKRAEVQRKRKRPDSEILALFGEPFHAFEGDPRYLKVQDALIRAWGLRALFAGETP